MQLFEEKNPTPQNAKITRKRWKGKKSKALYPKQITACIQSLFHHSKPMAKKHD